MNKENIRLKKDGNIDKRVLNSGRPTKADKPLNKKVLLQFTEQQLEMIDKRAADLNIKKRTTYFDQLLQNDIKEY